MKKAGAKKATPAKKAPKPVTIALSDGVELTMVPIPDKDYWMGKFPVTQVQWEAVMGENPSDCYSIGADSPVEMVSWDDCQMFPKKLNAQPAAQASGLTFRLPEEDEWKYACRAGAEGAFCKLTDGTEITEETLGEVAWFDEWLFGSTHPAGKKKPNAFGLYDMLGNVYEWTDTEVDDNGKVVASGESRANIGGSWLVSARPPKSAIWRSWDSPDNRAPDLGCRLCASGRAI